MCPNNSAVDEQGRQYAAGDLELFNLLTHPLWVFDIEGKCMYWANKSALELWQADSLESLLARDFQKGLTPATRTRMDDRLQSLRAGEVLSEQWTMYPQNVPTTANLTGSAIRITGGRIAVLMEAEISEKRFEDSSVREIELLRQQPLPVCQFKTDGTLIYSNFEAIRVYGNGAEKADADKTFLGLFVDKEVGAKIFQQVVEGDGADCNVEAEHFTADGSRRWFLVSVRRARDAVAKSKTDNVILLTARDITDVLQARRDSEAANLKAEFLAVLAHDIRTPLHQLIGYIELLEPHVLESEQKEHVHFLQLSAESLMGITNDLLDYSKLENGQLQVDTICFELPQLIDGCMTAVKHDAEEKGLRICKDVVGSLPSLIVSDPNRLRRILLNLLENAIKFTGLGQVTLRVAVVEFEWLEFEVSDTGMGIDAAQQETVFEKYHCARPSNYGGNGLGLAICRGFVEAMGGTIRLQSELQKGSTFSIRIPLQLPRKKRTASDMRVDVVQPEGKSLRILVAEDNKINQKVVRAMLHRIGHTVTIAENGQVAVDELKKNKFDLVLMDKMMPVMDGIEATKEIRKMGLSKATLPIVGLTASFQHSELGYYLECGMNDCVGKPVKLASLKRVIAEAASEYTSP